VRRTAAVFGFAMIFLAITSAIAGGPSADQILGSLKKGFVGVNDYRAGVSLTVKGPKVSINDMRMTLYFKKPNKVHIDTEQGVAIIPSGSFFGNPANDLAAGARPVYVRSERKLGRDCYLLKLTRQNPGPSMPEMMVWIDKQHTVIVAMESSTAAAMKTSWRYKMIDGKYYLPVEITAELRPPEAPNADQPVKATIKFSNYRVNKGISDKIFEDNRPKKDDGPHFRRRYHK